MTKYQYERETIFGYTQEISEVG